MIVRKRNTQLYGFLSLIFIFLIIGLIFIYSSSSVYALEKFGSAHYFVKKQSIGLLLGIVGLLLCSAIPLNFIKKLVPLIFFGALFLTIATFIPGIGQSINGSHRWVSIKGFGFQPSEFLKMALILYMAYMLSKKQFRLASFMHGYFPLLCILGVTSLVLLKQPDFGQTVTLSITSFILFFIAQCQIKHLLFTIFSFIPPAILLVLLKPYRLKRILTFLNPWEDPQGSGFQIIQSLIAIGSGNFFGVGISQSKQKFFYLPMQCTDFIFSIIAEETGLVGSTLLIILYVMLLYFGIAIAMQMKDLFSHYLILGFIILTSLQAVINIFVAIGLLPTKGLGLPFISYGNTALIANLCMVGFVVNCERNNRLQKN